MRGKVNRGPDPAGSVRAGADRRRGSWHRLPAAAWPPLLLLAAAIAACAPSGKDGGGAPPAPSRPVLRVGYMICDSLEDTTERFGPLTAYLAEKTGLDVVPVYLNTDEVPEAYGRGDLDVTHTNSLLYIIMREKGLEPLAGEKRGRLGFRSAGGIAVRADSPIRSLSELKGKRFGFGPMLAPTGFLSQYELLLDAGIDPELDLADYRIPSGSHKHEKVIYGVWLGAYDAAAVPMLDYELMVADGRLGAEDLRFLAVNDPVPYCVFGAAPSVDAKIVGALRSALMNLTPEVTVAVGGQRISVLGAASLEGFVPIRDGDFDRVREMARKSNMPPYQTY